MNPNYKGLYRIDIQANKAIKISQDFFTSDLEKYILSIINSIPENQNKKKFKFASETTEIRTAINMIFNEDFDAAGQICANRLLEKEIEAQEKMERLPNVEIQKGVLLVCYASDGESRSVIMTKNDNSEFISENNFKKTNGLPTKRKVFKAFVYNFNTTTLDEDIYVHDINSSISKYWWKHFLELHEVYTDKHNTRAVFEELEKSIFKKIKNEFRADHLLLKNGTIKEFRTNDVFNLGEYQKLWENYQPIDPDFPKEKLLQKVKNLAKSNKFDTLFKIAKEEITARMSNRIFLNNKIDLVIKEELDVIKNYIEPIQEADGSKYIKIKTDVGYETFKGREKN